MQAYFSNNAISRFRLIAFLEGCSYLLLGFTMLLKYHYLMPKPNYVVGMAHGVLFILYVLVLLYVAISYKWSLVKTGVVFIASLLPFGTFVADKYVLSKQASLENI